jgi:hypothetical protein
MDGAAPSLSSAGGNFVARGRGSARPRRRAVGSIRPFVALTRRMKAGSRRGAAIVEAVIMLPTLVILLLGARFLVRRYDADLAALRQARTCAIQFAYGGCKEVPVGCSASLEEAPSAPAPDAMGGISQQLAAAEGAVARLSSVPVLGSAVDALLGQFSRAESDVAFQGLKRDSAKNGTREKRPTARGKALFPCNEVPRTDDVAAQVFRTVTAPFF